LKRISEIIRLQRDKKGLLLREVAAEIELDQALLSKIERGERLPTKDQVLRLTAFYGLDVNEVLVAYISDKLVYELRDEELAIEAMQVAERKIIYNSKQEHGHR
jgi:HTH-type transcriptional regulator, competence development regulator